MLIRSPLNLNAALFSHRQTPSPPTLIWTCVDGLSLLQLSQRDGRARRWSHGWTNLPLILASSQHLINKSRVREYLWLWARMSKNTVLQNRVSARVIPLVTSRGLWGNRSAGECGRLSLLPARRLPGWRPIWKWWGRWGWGAFTVGRKGREEAAGSQRDSWRSLQYSIFQGLKDERERFWWHGALHGLIRGQRDHRVRCEYVRQDEGQASWQVEGFSAHILPQR